MNWADTPLLVYQAVAGHPAKPTAERELLNGAWGSTVLVLPEVYQVLGRTYGFAPQTAADAAEHLTRSPIHWEAVDLSTMAEAIAARARYGIDSADAALLHLAQADRGTLVTSDRRLLRAAQAQGIAVRNPVTPPLAAAVAQWEAAHLPPKGLSRVLRPVERWLRARSPKLADQFVAATAGLSQFPAYTAGRSW